MPLGIYNSNAFKDAAGVVQIVALANVEVRRESDGGLAAIFSDRLGASPITQVAYPGTTGFKADTKGFFQFFAAGIAGGYQVRVYSDDLTLDKTVRYQATGTARELDADPFWVSVWAAATKLAARIALKAMGLDGLVSRATNTILAAADSGKAFVATATFTQTLTAAATLGADWHVHYRVNAGAVVTLDPDGAELIDGAATKVLTGPSSGYLVCDGSAFFTYGFDYGTPASVTTRGLVELATQAEADAGAADRVATTDLNKIALGTPIATTSGTSHDFAIPAGTRRVKINFQGVSTNGTSVLIIQLGDAGGIEATGYLGTGSVVAGGGSGSANFTTGFGVDDISAAAAVYHGTIELNLLNSATFLWVASGGLARSDIAASTLCRGSKALSGELTQIRLTTVNGTNTFDGGSVNTQAER